MDLKSEAYNRTAERENRLLGECFLIHIMVLVQH